MVRKWFGAISAQYFSPRPPGEGAPERGAGAPVSGDATEKAHVSTRAVAALHPAPGSHPSIMRLEPAQPSAGAGVRVVVEQRTGGALGAVSMNTDSRCDIE